MQFRIAETFTASLQKLDGQAQKAAKMTAFDLQLNPAHPSMKLHKLAHAKDDNFWSVRVSRDIRLIVHKTTSSLLLCYVDHHDKAYRWAERRRIETHPNTGAAQIVEVHETFEQMTVPRYMPADEQLGSNAPLFKAVADDDLLTYGVPASSLADVRAIRDEDSLFQLIDHLPAEASEALIELATGDASARVLLTTFNDTLANALRAKLRRLIAHQPKLAERIEVAAIDTVACALYEKHVVAGWLRERATEAERPGEIAVIVRSEAEIERGREAIEAAGLTPAILDQRLAAPDDAVALGTMHLAKGLEFRALAIMACDDDAVPSQARLASASDPTALEEIYATERHLLYVAMTRARDALLITGIDPMSEFIEDLGDAA